MYDLIGSGVSSLFDLVKMSLSPQSSISLLAFAFTATVCVGLCSINRQLRSLKTQILKQDRYDANKDAKSSRAEAAADKIDLLLEMHSVLAHENVEGYLTLSYVH